MNEKEQQEKFQAKLKAIYGDDSLTIEEFIEKFKAIKNPRKADSLYEDWKFIFKYPEDWEFLKKQNPANVWEHSINNSDFELEMLVPGENPYEEWFEYYVTEIPGDSYIRINLGHIHIFRGSEDVDMDEFIKEWKIKPNHIHPENGLLFKDTPEELEFLKAYVKYDPDNPHALLLNYFVESYVWTYYESPEFADLGLPEEGLAEAGLLPPDEEQYDNVKWVFKGYLFGEKKWCEDDLENSYELYLNRDRLK